MISFTKVSYFLNCVDNKSSKKFIFLNIFFIFNSILQMVFILSFFFFLKTLDTSEDIFKSEKVILLFDILKLEYNKIYFLYFFLIFGIFANISNILVNYFKTNFTTNFLTKTRTFFYEKYSELSLNNFSRKNSSEYLNKIITQSERVCTVFLDSINNILLNIFLAIFILAPAIYYNSKITIYALISVSFAFVTISKIFKNKIKLFGKNVSYFSQNRIDLVNILYKNFSEIKINLAQNFYKKVFYKNELKSNNINKFLSILSHSLKPTVELILVILVFIFSLLIFFEIIQIDNFQNILILTMVILYRLIPAANTIYQSFNTIIFHYPAFENLDRELKTIIRENKQDKILKSINLDNLDINIKEIELKNIKFKINKNIILSNFNEKFNVDKIIGLKGDSGSGKTTLLNILLGLYKQHKGKIFVNGKDTYIYHNINWFKLISYMAQDVNLLRASIYQNIAFTLEEKKIDKRKIKKIISDLKLNKRFKNLDEIFIKSSGGEAQRLSLARSLYKNSRIILLDEPTNNLDKKNSEQLFNILNKLKKNRIIIIASHDQFLLKKCDKIVELK